MMGDWTMMGSYGFAHWVMFAVMVAVVVYPLGRILGRIGLSPFWSVLAFIPLANLIGLWVLAFAEWPNKQTQSVVK